MRSRNAAVGMVWRLLDRAVDAKFPAMIEAANAVVLDAAESERRAAMHAEFVEHADPPFKLSRNATNLSPSRVIRNGSLSGPGNCSETAIGCQ